MSIINVVFLMMQYYPLTASEGNESTLTLAFICFVFQDSPVSAAPPPSYVLDREPESEQFRPEIPKGRPVDVDRDHERQRQRRKTR